MAAVWKKAILVISAAELGLAGCSTPGRLPAVPMAEMPQTQQALGPIRFLVTRETDSMAAEAQNALVREQQWLASQGRTGDLPPAYFLAVSGGGDNGAYGAGFLNGWTANAGNAPRVAKAGNVIDDHNERNPRPRAHRFERNDARGHSQPGHSKAIHVLGRRFVRALRPS